MQHFLLALSIILLTIIAGNTIGKDNKQVMVMKVEKVEKKAPEKASIDLADEKFSVWYSKFDMIVN